MNAEIPFLCGKQTLQNWNFKIDGRERILEIQLNIDCSMMKIGMVDTSGGHYGVILETRARPVSSVNYIEDVPVLFLEDKKRIFALLEP